MENKKLPPILQGSPGKNQKQNKNVPEDPDQGPTTVHDKPKDKKIVSGNEIDIVFDGAGTVGQSHPGESLVIGAQATKNHQA